jgi:hypothetical protein
MRSRDLWAGILMLELVAAAPLPVLAASAEKVDCSRLSFSYAPAKDAEWTECYRFNRSEAPSDGVEGLKAEFQDMLADIGTHVVHINTGKAGRNTYFRRESIRTMVEDFDELDKTQDWDDDVDDYGDYKLIRFHATLWKVAADCIGFAKYGAAHISPTGGSHGFSKYMVGYDCWRNGVPDRAKIEASLSAIHD